MKNELDKGKNKKNSSNPSTNNKKPVNIDYNICTDEQLVALAKDGDTLAEELLIGRYKNLVRSKTRTYFLVGADSDDIMQEGMIGLFKAIRDFNPTMDISFSAFAEVCVIRQIITAIKRATRIKHMALNSYVSLNKPVYEDNSERLYIDSLIVDEVSNPEELMIVKESIKNIHKNIKEKLSAYEQKVLQLFLDGYSYTEIAKAVKKSTKSIDNALQRIKRKLNDLK